MRSRRLLWLGLVVLVFLVVITGLTLGILIAILI